MQKVTRRMAVAVTGMLVMALAGPVLAIDPIDEGALPMLSEEEEHRLHDQHGGEAGHLEPSSTGNIELIGKMHVNQDFKGRVADVGVLGTTAYLAAWASPDCQKGGVYVFDISTPSRPKQINFIRTTNDSYSGEGIQVVHLSTSQWTGDLLAFNNEDCTNQSQDPKFAAGKTSRHSVGGATFVDVTNPKVHRYLAQGVGDRTDGVLGTPTDADAHEIHSVFVWEDDNNTVTDTDDTAYAVLVDNEETDDVDILDITDPRAPVLIAEFNLNTTFPGIVDQLGTAESFLHDMVVKKIGSDYVMLLSYWDGGYVALNVNDPTLPTYIGDTDFPVVDELLNDRVNPDPNLPPEGNAHQAEFSLDNQYIVAADEDFDPYKPFLAIDGGAPTPFSAGTARTGPQLVGGDPPITGGTRFAGTGCDPSTFPAPAGATVAVIERGVCGFQAKLDNASAAGYDAAIVMNSTTGSPPCEALANMLATPDIHAFFVSRSVGYAILGIGGYNPANCPGGSNPSLPASGDPGLPISISVEFDGWGYVRLFEYESGKMTELDTYAIPEAHDPAFASGYGALSIHEVAMSQTWNNVAYFSYYSAGFRVAEIENGELVEKGHFIDATGDGGNDFWGVQVWQHGGEEYVLASDRDYGLYIFKYNPGD